MLHTHQSKSVHVYGWHCRQDQQQFWKTDFLCTSSRSKKVPAPGVHCSCLSLVFGAGSVWRSFVGFTIHQLVLIMWQFVDKLVSYMVGLFVVWFQQVDAIRRSFAEGWWFDRGLFSLTKMDIGLVMLEIECPTFIQQVRAVYQWFTLSTLCLASVKCLSLASSYISCLVHLLIVHLFIVHLSMYSSVIGDLDRNLIFF